MNEVVTRSLPTGVSRSTAISRSSLYSILKSVQKDSRVHFFLNRDDFIVRSQDINALARAVPSDRIYIFPYGGHMGNSTTSFHQDLYNKILTD